MQKEIRADESNDHYRITEEELEVAVGRMKNAVAPGPNLSPVSLVEQWEE